MEGDTIEELAKKNVSLRYFEIGKDDVLDGKEAVELSTEEKVDLSFVNTIKRRLPMGYNKVVIDNYGDETIIEFIAEVEDD